VEAICSYGQPEYDLQPISIIRIHEVHNDPPQDAIVVTLDRVSCIDENKRTILPLGLRARTFLLFFMSSFVSAF